MDRISLKTLVLRPLMILSRFVESLLRPRPLAVCFFALMVWPAAFHCLRPPLSPDISGFQLPLFGEPTKLLAVGENPLADRSFVLVSPGMLLATAALICTIIVLFRIERFSLAAGIMLAAWVTCDASVGINHPLIVDQMDREMELQKTITSLLAGTVEPELDILRIPRYDAAALYSHRGSTIRGLGYFPIGRWTFIALAIFAVACSAKGPLIRRLGVSGVWISAGLVAGGICCGRRFQAEWHWHQAEVAEAGGDLNRAEQMIEQSLRTMPALENLERTWALRGLIDFQREVSTPAARYFVGTKWAINGRLREVIVELESVPQSDRLAASLHRYRADAITNLAQRRYQEGNVGGAEQLVRLAVKLDHSLPHRQLTVAVLLSHRAVRNPVEIASLVEPQLPQLADRAMRASLLAMLGDSFFEAGQFEQARDFYQRSLKAYSLPKIINYRALRGLVGI